MISNIKAWTKITANKKVAANTKQTKVTDYKQVIATIKNKQRWYLTQQTKTIANKVIANIKHNKNGG